MTNEELRHASAWRSLIFGTYPIGHVLKVVQDKEWQRVRVSMLGTSLVFKHKTLVEYLKREGNDEDARARVTNYVYALKRAGLIK